MSTRSHRSAVAATLAVAGLVLGGLAWSAPAGAQQDECVPTDEDLCLEIPEDPGDPVDPCDEIEVPAYSLDARAAVVDPCEPVDESTTTTTTTTTTVPETTTTIGLIPAVSVLAATTTTAAPAPAPTATVAAAIAFTG